MVSGVIASGGLRHTRGRTAMSSPRLDGFVERRLLVLTAALPSDEEGAPLSKSLASSFFAGTESGVS